MTMLPIRRAPDVFAALRTHREEFFMLRNDFIQQYPAIRDELRAHLRDRLDYETADRVIDQIPSVDDIRGKFAMTWAIVPVGGSGMARDKVDQLQEAKAALYEIRAHLCDVVPRGHRHNDAIDTCQAAIDNISDVLDAARDMPRQVDEGAAVELVGEARRQMSQFAAEFVEKMAAGPRERLQKATSNLMEAIRDNRVIKHGTLKQVTDAIEMIRSFAFIQDDEIMGKLAEMEQHLGTVTPQSLNSDSVIAQQLAAAVAPVEELARDVQAVARNTRNFRQVNIGGRRRDSQPA
jgi:hypothetical protein